MEQQETKMSAGQRLLIVDDDPDLRMLLAGYFRRIGYEVEEKESAVDAIETAITGRFDCFIFDVSMPGMTGIDLLRRVRDRGIHTPAMFLTAHDTLDDKVAGFEAGADDYLGKPFNPPRSETRYDSSPCPACSTTAPPADSDDKNHPRTKTIRRAATASPAPAQPDQKGAGSSPANATARQ